MRTPLALMMPVVLATTLSAQAPAAPTPAELAPANAAFVRSDWQAALDAYTALSAKYPKHAASRFRAGVALMELGRYREAELALQQGEQLGIPAGQAAWRLAQLHARQGHADAAFGALLRGLGAGLPVIPLTLAADPHFAPVRSDPRWARTLDSLDAVTYPCKRDPRSHEFDFWIGDWEVWQTGTPRPPTPARNTVSVEDDGCVVMEHWTAPGGSEGQSFNLYDYANREWRQTWVDNSGGQHDYHGGLKDGNMAFTGTVPAPNRAPGRAPVRLTFFPLAKDTVRQLSEISTDSGTTWRVNYDLTYVRRGDARGAPLNVNDLAQLRALDSAFVRGWLEDDTVAVLGLFAPDAVLLPPNSAPVSGIPAIRAWWWPADGSHTTITAFERTMEEIGGNRDLAYIRARASLAWKLVKGGKTTRQTSRANDLLLLVRDRWGTWKVTRQMWTPG